MRRLLLRAAAIARNATKPVAEAVVGALTVGLLRTIRYFDPIKTANFFGRVMRLIGPKLREQTGSAATISPPPSPRNRPRKSRPSWPASGTISAASVAEFAHLDHVWELRSRIIPNAAAIEIEPRSARIVRQAAATTASRR